MGWKLTKHFNSSHSPYVVLTHMLILWKHQYFTLFLGSRLSHLLVCLCCSKTLSSDPEVILCNNTKMLRERLSISEERLREQQQEQDSDYVYDLYYQETVTPGWIQDILSVRAYADEGELVCVDGWTDRWMNAELWVSEWIHGGKHGMWGHTGYVLTLFGYTLKHLCDRSLTVFINHDAAADNTIQFYDVLYSSLGSFPNSGTAQ